MITINSIDYECIEQTANEIAQGYKCILRLPESAEKGRILGGRNAIEASLIVGLAEATNRTEPEVDTLKKLQEIVLEKYANHKHIWFDYETEITENWEGVEGRGGQEAEVYRGREGFLRKVFDYYQNSDSPLEFLDNRISVHNMLFPETKYELFGFTKKRDRLQFILEQPFVKGRNHGRDDFFPQYMEKLGYEQIDDTTYYNHFFLLRDLHEANVLKTDKGFAFIDTIPSFLDKTMYMNFQVISV
ncbi:hypothetical protein FACS1894199_19280 [Bacteroidia bacterium]|nr:hypothetical protein FACS1894199_19280 [Bacteroidia bacterium]